MADPVEVWDPFDQDGDGVFWDPEIGVDNSPSAEAARAKKAAQDAAKKKQAKAKREAENAATKAKKQEQSAASAADTAAAVAASVDPLAWVAPIAQAAVTNPAVAIGGAVAAAILLLLLLRK